MHPSIYIYPFNFPEVIFSQSCSLLPIITQIELNARTRDISISLPLRIEQNRLPLNYLFFPYIYYTEHSYTHLKLIFVRNSWQYISKNGKIFLKMERSFIWLISTPLIHPLRHRPFKASFMHSALFETPSPCFYAFKIV